MLNILHNSSTALNAAVTIALLGFIWYWIYGRGTRGGTKQGGILGSNPFVSFFEYIILLVNSVLEIVNSPCSLCTDVWLLIHPPRLWQFLAACKALSVYNPTVQGDYNNLLWIWYVILIGHLNSF